MSLATTGVLNLLLHDEERGAVWSATRQYKKRTRQNVVTRYEITVEDPGHVCQGVALLELDGKAFAGTAAIALTDDGRTHSVRVVLGENTATRMPR